MSNIECNAETLPNGNSKVKAKLTPSGKVEIQDNGWYFIQISVSLHKSAIPTSLRDILCVQLYKNGSLCTTETNSEFRGYNAYADIDAIPQVFTAQAAIKLSAGDIISLSAEIVEADRNGGTDLHNGAINRTQGIYRISNNTVGVLTGRYLGVF